MSKYSCTMAELDAGMNREAVLLDLPTDPALWEIRPKFGVASGPDELVLTDEGAARPARSEGRRTRTFGRRIKNPLKRVAMSRHCATPVPYMCREAAP
jgi:hypothetical protein